MFFVLLILKNFLLTQPNIFFFRIKTIFLNLVPKHNLFMKILKYVVKIRFPEQFSKTAIK